MSLTTEDFQTIRQIVHEVVDPLHDKIEAQGNDIKEIYNILVKNGLNLFPADE